MMRRRDLTRFGAMACAAACVLTLGACTNPFSLPVSGDVQTLEPVEQTDKRIYTVPDGPQDNDRPEAIVSGFFNAMPAGVQNDGFSVAREFLGSRAAGTWNGDHAALVYSGSPSFRRGANVLDDDTDEVVIEVEVHVLGRLDAHGLFTAMDDAQASTIEYTLAKVDDQWRIVDLPQGVVVSEADFEQAYRQVSVYRTDPSRQVLIPDVRWLGWRNWRTLAVREALEAPADWLAGAAADLNDGRVSLDVDSVPMDADGQVHVQLTGDLEQLDADSRALLVRLIRLTLGDGSDSYENLRITTGVNGDYSDADRDVVLAAAQPVSSIYSLSAGNIVLLSSSSPLRVGQTAGFDDALGFVFSDGGGAVLRADRIVECLGADGSSCGVMFGGRRMSMITKGVNDEIWAVGESGRDLFVSQGEQGTAIAVPWLGDGVIRSIAVAPEGCRMALSIERDDESSVQVSGLVRADGTTVGSMADTASTVAVGGTVTMMTFYNDETLVYATDGQDGDQEAWRQLAPGVEESQNLPAGTVVALASGQISSYRRLAALDERGMVRSVRGSLDGAWSVADSQVTALSAQ